MTVARRLKAKPEALAARGIAVRCNPEPPPPPDRWTTNEVKHDRAVSMGSAIAMLSQSVRAVCMARDELLRVTDSGHPAVKAACAAATDIIKAQALALELAKALKRFA